MLNVLMVALGGACGAVLRFTLVSGAQALGWTFPVGTLLVNVLGSLVIGMVAAYWLNHAADVSIARNFFQTGLLGAFTTFSAFSLDTVNLWNGGESRLAILNVVANVMLCVAAVAIGMLLVGLWQQKTTI